MLWCARVPILFDVLLPFQSGRDWLFSCPNLIVNCKSWDVLDEFSFDQLELLYHILNVSSENFWAMYTYKMKSSALCIHTRWNFLIYVYIQDEIFWSMHTYKMKFNDNFQQLFFLRNLLEYWLVFLFQFYNHYSASTLIMISSERVGRSI